MILTQRLRTLSHWGNPTQTLSMVSRKADPEVVHEIEFVVPDVILKPLPSGHVGTGMASMDEVDLNTIFSRRANVMRSIPHFLKGPYRAAVRLGMREASCAHETGDMLTGGIHFHPLTLSSKHDFIQ